MTHKSSRPAATLVSAVVALMMAGATPVLAQVAMEEIVVTARKRAENLQDIPLAITAFTAETLERKGIDNIEDIARLTAGVIVDEGTFPQDIRVVIRGLSPTRGRPNVAFLLDGVDVTSESVQSAGGSLLINPRLFDLERVEVVKGPQSALYGRSAFSGAINYVTRKPTNEWEGQGSLQVGQRGDTELSVGIYGPLVEDRVLVGLNAAWWNFDGFYDNSVTDADLGDADGYGVSGSVIFNFTDDLSFTSRVEYTDDHLGQSPTVFGGTNGILPVPPSAFGPIFMPGVVSPAVPFVTAFTGPVPDGADLPAVTISEDPQTGQEFRGSEREILRIAGTLDWNLGFGTATSVTHYASADVFQRMENTRKGSFNALVSGTLFSVATDTTLFSQELRLQSGEDEGFRWMFGGLYWEEDVNQDSFGIACTNNQLFPGLPFLPCGPFFGAILASNTPNLWIRDTEHWSAFGMLEFDLADRFTLHFEGRYTDEELYVSGPSGPRIVDVFGLAGPPNAFPGPTPNVDGNSTDSYFAPRFSLEYTFTDDMLVYASAARGAKPAGISTIGAGSAGFDPELFVFDRETMWVYEVGAKTSWADGRFIANASAYWEDFSGKQTSTQVLRENGLTGLRTVNASGAEVKGFEVDLGWALTDSLSLSAGYSYIDAQYTDFVVNESGVNTVATVGNCVQEFVGRLNTCRLDRSGHTLERTAKHSLVLSASYTAPLTDEISWLIETDLQSQSKRFDTADNILTLPSYTLVDLRVGLTGENWDVIAFVDNVFEDDTVKIAFNATDFDTINLAFFPPPFTFILTNALHATLPNKRQAGIRIGYNF